MFGRPFEVTWRQEDTAEALQAAFKGNVTPCCERGCTGCGSCGLDGDSLQ